MWTKAIVVHVRTSLHGSNQVLIRPFKKKIEDILKKCANARTKSKVEDKTCKHLQITKIHYINIV